MDPLWISIAFIFGFLANRVKLPPLTGYLVAGFLLSYLGATHGEVVSVLSDVGVMLLLFTIGLKLRFKTLLKPEIWAGASIHLSLTAIFTLVGIWLLGFTGLQLFSGLGWKASLLIALAMSFSSTVFAVKTLEEKGETTSLHGKTSIGMLIMQDIFAVIFMVVAAGKVPNWYALGLPLVLLLLRPLLFYILRKSGHGELLILFGFFAALVAGAELFRFTGLKADLGALVVGMMLAKHAKAGELSDKLLNFKDIFLIGFFLSIGMSGQPDIHILIAALIVSTAIIVKAPIYFLVLTRFRLRARTSFLTSVTLANFSEFGLLVSAVGAKNGWISGDWLLVIAIALSISFILASPLNTNSYSLYSRLKDFLHKFETRKRLSYDIAFDIGDAEILIFGMGRLGTPMYDHLQKTYGKSVLALDYNIEKVKAHQQAGRNVIHDDSTDMDFWDKMNEHHLKNGQVKLVALCLGDHNSHVYTINRLNAIKYAGKIAATAKYEDELISLKKLGVDSAFDLYSEAGAGFADHVCQSLCKCDTENEKSRP